MAGGKFARVGLLAPLAFLILAVASALIVIASIILNKIVDSRFNGQGSRFNRLSPTLQWLQILACAFAFAAAWTTFWHTKTYRASTRYVSGSHSWLAFFIAAIAFGVSIKAVCIRNLDALNWVGIILTWILTGLLLFLALLLHAPLNKNDPAHYHHHRHHDHTGVDANRAGEKELPYTTSPAGAGFGTGRSVV